MLAVTQMATQSTFVFACSASHSWEIYNPQGPISRSPATHSLAVHCGVGTPDGSSNHRGSGRSRHSYSRTRVNRSAFLSRDVLSRWLEPHAPHIEVLCISHTEVRTSVVGYNPKAPSRHDLQARGFGGCFDSFGGR